MHTQNSPSYSSFGYIMSICADHSFCNCSDEVGKKHLLKSECFKHFCVYYPGLTWAVHFYGWSCKFPYTKDCIPTYQKPMDREPWELNKSPLLGLPSRLAQNSSFAEMRFNPQPPSIIASYEKPPPSCIRNKHISEDHCLITLISSL